ncbi:hypothetical protein S83_051304, partial [Arachis hypogaea]
LLRHALFVPSPPPPPPLLPLFGRSPLPRTTRTTARTTSFWIPIPSLEAGSL